MNFIMMKFMMSKIVGDRQFQTRQSRRSKNGTLDDLCILVLEVSQSTRHRILMKSAISESLRLMGSTNVTEDHKRQRVDSSHGFFCYCAAKVFLTQLSQELKPGHFLHPSDKPTLAGGSFLFSKAKKLRRACSRAGTWSWYDMGVQKLPQSL